MRHVPIRRIAMKSITSLCLLALLLLCGCARHYTITTNNGSQIAARGKPKLQEGVYVYTDLQGRRASVPAGRVREIAPSSISTAPSSQFKAVR
jgi:hypothetical protein